jgi:uncharacterized metal-binding protein YceD (DUF177 family)
MKSLAHYSIPINGLNLGVHKYEFTIDKSFFNQFENSPIHEGTVEVLINLEKDSSMITVDFVIEGFMNTDCDRCLQPIKLPLKKEYQILIKYAEEAREEAEIVYIPEDTASINMAKYIYEFVVLSIPMNKVYECEEDVNAPCDEEMLKFLSHEDDQSKDNPIWEELKNLGNLEK